MWQVLNIQVLATAMTLREIDECRSLAPATGQTADDILASVLSQVAAEVRGHISASGRNRLSLTTDSVAPETLSAAAILARHRLAGRVGYSLPHRETRAKELEDAQAYLRLVGSGKVALSQPDDPDSSPRTDIGGQFQIINPPTRVTSRDSMSGL